MTPHTCSGSWSRPRPPTAGWVGGILAPRLRWLLAGLIHLHRDPVDVVTAGDLLVGDGVVWGQLLSFLNVATG